MDSYYGYTTALWYWRTAVLGSAISTRVHRSPSPDDYVYTSTQERAQRPNWLDPLLLSLADDEVHLLVFHRSRRKSQGTQRWHLWQEVPRDSFVPAGDSSFVPSPEFLFLQMASELEFLDLVLLGMELCGFYRLDPTEEDGFGKRPEPLTSCARLRSFLADNPNIRGRRKAEAAMRQIADGAASPMEAAIYLALCLPFGKGGYGLPRPYLNYPIELDGNARKLTSKMRCWGDICWPDARIDLEYLCVHAHGGGSKMLADRGRTLAIEEMGYEVVEITKDQALDLGAFDVIAQRLAVRVGKRLRREYCGRTAERMRLFEAVYSWEARTARADRAARADMQEAAEDDGYGVVYGARR